VGWAVWSIIDALFISKKGIKACFKPMPQWGPNLTKHKRLAFHLDNLKEFHSPTTKGEVVVEDKPEDDSKF
jgi:hypothetical protein